jgi:hypothetical protein
MDFEFLFGPVEHVDEWLTGLIDGAPLAVALGIAFVLGLRHASDPDHLVAVTSHVAADPRIPARCSNTIASRGASITAHYTRGSSSGVERHFTSSRKAPSSQALAVRRTSLCRPPWLAAGSSTSSRIGCGPFSTEASWCPCSSPGG